MPRRKKSTTVTTTRSRKRSRELDVKNIPFWCPNCKTETIFLAFVYDGDKDEDEYIEYVLFICPNCLTIYYNKWLWQYDSEIGKHIPHYINSGVAGKLELNIVFTRWL